LTGRIPISQLHTDVGQPFPSFDFALKKYKNMPTSQIIARQRPFRNLILRRFLPLFATTLTFYWKAHGTLFLPKWVIFSANNFTLDQDFSPIA
jgi:hypothetical protein